MKKKAAGLGPLITEVRRLIQSARRGAASVVNTLQVMTNFEIGRRIVEHEQKGKKRAGYGDLVVRSLAGRLTREFGRGFSKRNLDYMRRFFLDYSGRLRIVQKPSAQFSPGMPQTLSAELVPALISETASRKSPFTRAVKLPEENSTIGILLCQRNKQAIVELTLPKDANIHAREYQLYLPSKELLKAKLIEWARAESAKA